MGRESVVTFGFGNIEIKVFRDSVKKNPAVSGSLLHTHAGFEFHQVIKGEFYFHTEDKKAELKAGDMIIVSPEEFHKIDGESDAEILSFNFFVSERKGSDEWDYYNLFSSLVLKEGFYIIEGSSVSSEMVLNKIKYDSPLATESTKASFVLLFAEILGRFSVGDQSQPEKKEEQLFSDSPVHKIEDYFNEHYMEDIGLNKLASDLYLSEKQINRIIKKSFGGFNEHLRKIRLKNAKKFLKDTALEVKEIAEAVGYKSYNGFYLAFKNEYNITPLEYREKNK